MELKKPESNFRFFYGMWFGKHRIISFSYRHKPLPIFIIFDKPTPKIQ